VTLPKGNFGSWDLVYIVTAIWQHHFPGSRQDDAWALTNV